MLIINQFNGGVCVMIATLGNSFTYGTYYTPVSLLLGGRSIDKVIK